MKKITLIVLVISLLYTGCSKQVANQSPTTIDTIDVHSPDVEYSVLPTIEPPDDRPKYIFIVIGDGLGQGHMLMGNIYARIEGNSMGNGAVWESWPQQKFVEGRGESAGGGSALATGYVVSTSTISITHEKNDLVTIMDRAKQNGMSTGVVTNSNLVDATPATFYAHTGYRMSFEPIVEDCPSGNIDYLAGGGMNDYIPIGDLIDYDKRDACGFKASPKSKYTTLPTLIDMGYSTYIGYTDAQKYLELVENDAFRDPKSICLFSSNVMPYETYKMAYWRAEPLKYMPSLIDMTDAGIQTLSQNPNGFVMMIEEASIDKTGHSGLQASTMAQVRLLNDTLKLIMQFYNDHPKETLVILTADHENGEYVWDMDRYNEFLAYEDFTYTDNAQAMTDFLLDSWDLNLHIHDIQDFIDINNAKHWDTDEENIANLYNYIAYEASLSLGIERTTVNHSWQTIPCYSIGAYSQRFAQCEGIEHIPQTISDIMGWEPLPEEIIVPVE